jgi:cation transport regulator
MESYSHRRVSSREFQQPARLRHAPAPGEASAIGDRMPYATNDDLPLPIRSYLPSHAQDIFRAAFNSAWQSYAVTEIDRREEIADRVAWSAVKRKYRKMGDHWVPS